MNLDLFFDRALQSLIGRRFGEFGCFFFSFKVLFVKYFPLLEKKVWLLQHFYTIEVGILQVSHFPKRCHCSSLQDVTEEDINAELAVIHSQMAYIMQLQGRADEALQLYNQVIKLKWVSGSSA